MADSFEVDAALLDLIKDREVLDGMLAEVAGEQVADANAKATGKVKRQIIADCLAGTNGRAKVERFVPRWMTFPPSAYTTRGGVQAVSRAAVVECLFAPSADTDSTSDGPDASPAEGDTAAEVQPVAKAA
jgi:ParB family chromosome partitioning protein